MNTNKRIRRFGSTDFNFMLTDFAVKVHAFARAALYVSDKSNQSTKYTFTYEAYRSDKNRGPIWHTNTVLV